MAQVIPLEVQEQAIATLHRIERRIAHILTKLQQAAKLILQKDDVPEWTPSVADVESLARHWQDCVPDDPEVRAVALHLLAENYALASIAIPDTLENLGWGNPQVLSAYNKFYDEPFTPSQATAQPSDTLSQALHGLEWMYLKRGETLIQQGGRADKVYAVLDGLLRADVAGEDGLVNFSTRLQSGEVIGNLAWLTNEPYSSTVVALRDSDIVYMSGENFDRYIQQHPNNVHRLAQRAVNLLRETMKPEVISSATRSIAILPATAGLGNFLDQLMDVLRKFGNGKAMTAASMMEALGDGADLDDEVDAYDFVDWLEQQQAAHDFVIYVGDIEYPNWTRRCIEEADRILVVARGDVSSEISPAEIILQDMPHPEFLPPVDLVLVHDHRSLQPSNTEQWLARRSVVNHYHVALDHPADFERLVRHLRGRAIGIVFGGGGMRGLAHAGVIQALQDRGIDCDIAGGTSSGAIIAGLYGLEWDADNIKTAALHAMDRKVMFQPTLPITSVVTGNRLSETYQAMFGDWRIEDMWRPIFTIASNLTQAKMTVKDNGGLQKAVRASTSLAGILPPAIDDNGDLLLDGGAFNNTPADVMRGYVGTGTVIAVDLGYTKREFPEYQYNDVVNGWKVLWSRINPFRERIQVPAIIDIMMRSNGLGGMNATAAQVAHADLVIRPPVTEFGLYDKEAADEIFMAGYTAGQQAIDEWIDEGGLGDTHAPGTDA